MVAAIGWYYAMEIRWRWANFKKGSMPYMEVVESFFHHNHYVMGVGEW